MTSVRLTKVTAGQTREIVIEVAWIERIQESHYEDGTAIWIKPFREPYFVAESISDVAARMNAAGEQEARSTKRVG